MQRRDFFKAISAAAAALTAGSTALARPTPKVKVSADTTGFVEGVRRTADDLRWEQYLADAKMVSVNVSTTVDGSDVEIEYIVPPKRSHA